MSTETKRRYRLITCEVCGGEFGAGGGFVAHMKKHRADELPTLQCPHCPRTFKFEGPYSAHVLSHDDALRETFRFWPKVDKNGTVPAHRPDLGQCWLWTGTCDSKGYGCQHVPFGPKSWTAHKYAYERTVGPVPDGLELDHLCHVRHCVNPAHLEPVTREENNRRMHAWEGNKAECPICGLRANKGNLARHMKAKHPESSYCRKGDANG